MAVSAIAPFWLVVTTADSPAAPRRAGDRGSATPSGRRWHELRDVDDVRTRPRCGPFRGDEVVEALEVRLCELRGHHAVRALDVEQDGLRVAAQRLAELPQVVAHLRAVLEHLGRQLARPGDLLPGVGLRLLARL